MTKVAVNGKIKIMKEKKEQNKILMVVAPRDFRDEEYFIPKEIFEKNGYKVLTASISCKMAIGRFGGEAEIDLEVSKANADNFDSIVFVGGSGVSNFIDDKDFHSLAKEAVKAGKVVGAICVAPAILAKAGILKGKNATVWHSTMDKSAMWILEGAGAKLGSSYIVIDGNIITACGPENSREFAKAIIKMLKI
jgi:protease I